MKANKSTGNPKKTNLNAQHLAIIAYLTPFGLIAAYFLNQKKKFKLVSFHLKNMFGLVLFTYLGVIATKLGLNRISEFILYLGLILWVFSIYYAYKKELKGLPYLDKHFAKWFKFLD